MRISDWSSDVCSSDLRQGHFVGRHQPGQYFRQRPKLVVAGQHQQDQPRGGIGAYRSLLDQRRQDRKSVVEGKSVSVRVDLGGSRSLKKKRNNKYQKQYKRVKISREY